MSEWISVEDRLPEDDRTVLFHLSSIYQEVDYNTNEPVGEQHTDTQIVIGYIKDKVLWIDYDQDNIDEFKDVTHWMPLPEPPQ